MRVPFAASIALLAAFAGCGTGNTPSPGGRPPAPGDQFDPSRLGPAALPPVAQCEAVSGSACYYASPAGAGTACSETDPCRVKTALPLLRAGDFLYLLGGTYVASGSSSTAQTEDQIYIDKYFSFAGDPSASARIVIEGMPGQNVVMHGNQTDPCAFIDGQSYVTFEGIVFDNCGPAGVLVGYDVSASTHDVVIANNEFHDLYAIDNMGAAYFGGVSDATFENNIVHDFHYQRAPGDSNSTGLIAFVSHNLTIRNNEIYNVGMGFYYKHGEAVPGAGGFTHVYANYIHDTYAHGLGTNQNRTELRGNIFANTQNVYLFNSDGTVADFVFDVDIEYNTFAGSSLGLGAPSDGFSGSRRTTIRHNVFVDSPYHVWTYSLDVYCEAGVGLVTDDNCFFDSTGALVFDYFGDNDSGTAYGLISACGGLYSFAEWSGLGFDAASVVGDPLLDPTYHTASGSPCGAYGAYAH